MQGIHNSPPDGVHYLLEFFGCAKEQLDSLPFWKKLLSKTIVDSGITVLNKHFYRFSPHGITGYLLLLASHISIHTWPEYKDVTCDVFSCGDEDETGEIVRYISEQLVHHRHRMRRIKQGYKVRTAAL